MKKDALNSIYLSLSALLLIVMGVSPAVASEACEHIFSKGIKDLESSLSPKTEAMVRSNRFNTWRDLDDYRRDFGSDFFEALSGLKNGEIWIDAGAGLARAQLQFLKEFGKQSSPALIAAALTYPKTRPQMREVFDLREYRAEFKNAVQTGKLKYIEEDIASLGARSAAAGKVNLITDDYGPATYADFSRILQIYGHLLGAGGSVFINMPKMKIQRPDGADLNHFRTVELETFFKEVTGFDVTVVDKKYSQVTMLKMTRNDDSISVPQLLPLGVRFESWGNQSTAFEWVRTKEEWKYSRFNPEYVLYQGFKFPGVKPPE